MRIFLGLLLILILLPVSTAFSQVTDTKPTLSVMLTNNSPYVYQDDEGYTVVIGSVKNTNPLTAVNNVHVRVVFYDDVSPAPLEFSQGRTVLEVIPALGTSPYVIKSKTPNPQITQASVFLDTFNSSISKSKLLSIDISDTYLADDRFVLSGILKNGPAPASNSTVYVALYDAFNPPRILDVLTVSIGDMNPNQQIPFNLEKTINQNAVKMVLFSESNIFYSDFIEQKVPGPEILTKLVTISNVSITDVYGKPVSDIKLGSTIQIQSNSIIQLSSSNTSNEIPYTYYVQVKEAGEKPYVEFVGKYDGRYIGQGTQSQSIDWIPTKKGLFFVETFVWDRTNVPIADKGPVAIILIN